jgi:hypothetical protein
MPPEGPSLAAPVDMSMPPELELVKVAAAVRMDTAPDTPADAVVAPEAREMYPPNHAHSKKSSSQGHTLRRNKPPLQCNKQ